MPTLTIEGATQGYDFDNVHRSVNKIITDVFIASANVLETEAPKCAAAVDAIWKGQSANAFKDKIERDTETVVNDLKTLEEAFKGQFNAIMQNLNNSDAAVAAALLGEDYTPSSTAYDRFQNTVQTWNNAVNTVKRVDATIDTVTLGLVEGIGELGEALVDVGALAGTLMQTPGTLIADGVTSVLSNFTGVDYGSSTRELWENTQAFVSNKYVNGWFDKFYENTTPGQYMKENAYGFDTTRSISSGIGYTAGVVGLSIVTAGAGSALLGGTGAISSAGLATSMASIGGSAGFAKASQNAWADGATLEEGLAVGAIRGGFDAVSYGGGVLLAGATPFASTAANVATRITADTALGALSTPIDTLADSVYKNGYVDENGNFVEFTENDTFAKKYAELFDDNGGFVSVGINSAVAATASGIGEATHALRNLKVKSNEYISNNEFLNGSPKNPHSAEAIARNNEIAQMPEYQELLRQISDNENTLAQYGATRKESGLITNEVQSAAEILAKQKRAAAEAAEPAITDAVKSLETDSRQLVGLSHKLKGDDSLARKIASDAAEAAEKAGASAITDAGLETATQSIGDSVRYTMLCDEGTMAKDVTEVLTSLTDQGYTVTKFSNTFDQPTYKGINTNLIAPDGTKFELQFHTDVSFSVKEETNHVFYEIARNKVVTTEEQRAMANTIMEKAASIVSVPEEVVSLSKTQFVDPAYLK